MNRQNFLIRYPKWVEKVETTKITDTISDSTSFINGRISQRYPIIANIPADIAIIVDRCIADLTNIYLLRSQQANLNDNGLHLMYKEVMDVIEQIANGSISSTTTLPDDNNTTKSWRVISQPGYYSDNDLYEEN